MNQANLLRRCAELAEAGAPFVLVTLIEATGSTPQDAGREDDCHCRRLGRRHRGAAGA